MAKREKPDYGNWVPMKMIVVSLVIFVITCVLSVVIGIMGVRIALIMIAALSGIFAGYIGYAYWLLKKNDGEIQKKICNTLVEKIAWDGRGKALDIGTGSGRVAIAVASRFPSSSVTGVDPWGSTWAYSRDVCYRNAVIEGVADRVHFQQGVAGKLPFDDGEFDMVTCNYVFHTVKVKNSDRKELIKEALRVLKDGGIFVFQDLFNKQFYGDIRLLLDELKTWGLKDVEMVNTQDYVHIPVALKIDHMVGGSKILYGVK